MRKRFINAIAGYYRRWQEKNEGERLVLIVQYLTILTMALKLFQALY